MTGRTVTFSGPLQEVGHAAPMGDKGGHPETSAPPLPGSGKSLCFHEQEPLLFGLAHLPMTSFDPTGDSEG